MTPRASRIEPEAGRRSHAERTAETRARVMEAVVASIAEVGFQRTTAAEITRRAGVSWGAVQHHFGGKDGVLEAVVSDSFDRFAARLSDVGLDGKDLEARVTLFVERAWEHFGSLRYRSTVEILLNHPGAETDAWREMLRTWNGVWSRFFPTPQLSRREVVDLQIHAISLLAGLATVRALGEPAARWLGGPLRLLREGLLEHLEPHPVRRTRGDGPRRRRSSA